MVDSEEDQKTCIKRERDMRSWRGKGTGKRRGTGTEGGIRTEREEVTVEGQEYGEETFRPRSWMNFNNGATSG